MKQLTVRLEPDIATQLPNQMPLLIDGKQVGIATLVDVFPAADGPWTVIFEVPDELVVMFQQAFGSAAKP